MKELWEILIPTEMVKDDGKGNILWKSKPKPIKKKHHQEWDKKVRNISGGLTILTPAKGQWIAPRSDILYNERVIPVRIACSKEDIDKIAKITLKHYRQLVVMYYKISNEVYFYEEIN